MTTFLEMAHRTLTTSYPRRVPQTSIGDTTLGDDHNLQTAPLDANGMSGYPDHYVNLDLCAENAIEMPVSHPVVLRCHASVRRLIEGDPFEGVRVDESTGIGLYSVRSGWNGDLRWISSGNMRAFELFDRCFDELDVIGKTKARLGDHGDLIMYSGFFVIRSEMTESYYHVDYSDGVGMNALTLMTPVAPTGEKGNLLYTDIQGSERVYTYAPGTAVAFGANFHHSTQPFQSETPYVFLCFTYGVRDPSRWDQIEETVAHQGHLYRHPTRGVVRTGD